MEELLNSKLLNSLIGIYFGIVIYLTHYFTKRKFLSKTKISLYILSVLAVIGIYITVLLFVLKKRNIEIYSPMVYIFLGVFSAIFACVIAGKVIRKKRESYKELIKKEIEELIPDDVLQNPYNVPDEKRRKILERTKNIEKFEKLVKEGYFFTNSGTYERLGTFHYLKGDYEKAIDEWEMAYSQNPNIEGIEYNIAIAYLRLKDFEKALLWLEKSTKSKSYKFRFDSYFSKGWIYDELEKYEKAIEAYKEARQVDPNNFWVDYNEACSYAKMGKTKEALDKLKLIIDNIGVKEKMRIDPDFKNIREDSESRYIFENLIKNNSERI